MNLAILCVDDDPQVLGLLELRLGKRFSMRTAGSGAEALETLSQHPEIAVIVSDMHMPGMDGVELLGRVKSSFPLVVRIMLTGDDDQKTAASAVNRGSIYAFLSKPIANDELLLVVESAFTQYRLVSAERELLEKTLAGSVQVLTETLSLVNPLAFGRASRLRTYVRHVCRALDVKDAWRYELAAMLSQLGCVSLHPEIMEKIHDGRALTRQEAMSFAAHPGVACGLLASIPRLEAVARMIEGQQSARVPASSAAPEDEVALGSRMIKVAIGVDDGVQRGQSLPEVLEGLGRFPADFDPRLLGALASLQKDEAESFEARVADLEPGMILDQDLLGRGGRVAIPRGQQVGPSVLAKLQSLAGDVDPEARVRVRAQRAREAALPT